MNPLIALKICDSPQSLNFENSQSGGYGSINCRARLSHILFQSLFSYFQSFHLKLWPVIARIIAWWSQRTAIKLSAAHQSSHVRRQRIPDYCQVCPQVGYFVRSQHIHAVAQSLHSHSTVTHSHAQYAATAGDRVESVLIAELVRTFKRTQHCYYQTKFSVTISINENIHESGSFVRNPVPLRSLLNYFSSMSEIQEVLLQLVYHFLDNWHQFSEM